jgi:hypothetical protein
MWDNRCTVHSVEPFDNAPLHRVMHRVTLVGEGRAVAGVRLCRGADWPADCALEPPRQDAKSARATVWAGSHRCRPRWASARS